jgi:hypothetical protein
MLCSVYVMFSLCFCINTPEQGYAYLCEFRQTSTIAVEGGVSLLSGMLYIEVWYS